MHRVMSDISISAYEELLCTAPQLLAEDSAANMKLNWNDRFTGCPTACFSLKCRLYIPPTQTRSVQVPSEE